MTPSPVPDTDQQPTTRRLLLQDAAEQGRLGVAQALNTARQNLGLSYRALERQSGLRIATLQGWLSGKYVPQVGMRQEFTTLISTLDLADDPAADGGVQAEDWWTALRTTEPDPVRPADIPPPYPGMRPYDLTTAEQFPGRAAQLRELRDLIAERLDGAEQPLLLVTGRSGIGKSSLTAAAAAGMDSAPHVDLVTPSPEAVDVLAAAADGSPADAADAPAAGHIIIVDQAESLWTSATEQLRARLLELIGRLQQRTGRLALVLVMRVDAIAPAADVPLLRDGLQRSHFVLGPITRDDARRILTGPTAAHGITMDPELVTLILQDAGDDPSLPSDQASEALATALPLLSQIMRTLWRDRTDPRRITLADYQRAGGVPSAIESAAEAGYETLSAEAKAACWPTLQEMIRLDGPHPARRATPREEITDPASLEVVDTLLDAHLLMSDGSGLTISHDLLLTTWPRLASWIDSARDWTAARRLLARYSMFWDDSGRPDDLLTTSNAALILEAAAGEDTGDRTGFSPGELTRIEREFLEASRDAQDEQLRIARAENETLRRSTRRFRTAAVLASTFAIIGLVLGVTAITAAVQVNESRARALGGEIATRSQVVGETMPGSAAQLAIAAHDVDDSLVTRSTLLSETATPQPRRILTDPGTGVLAATQDVLVQAGASSLLRLIAPGTGETIQEITAPSTDITAADVRDVGGDRLVAAVGPAEGGHVAQGCLWEASAQPQQLGCAEIPAASEAAAILPDGSGVLFGASDGTIHRLSIDGAAAQELEPIAGPSRRAGVSGLAAVGERVLVTAADGTTATVSDPLGEAAWAPAISLPRAQSAAISPDGTRFAVPTQELTVELGRVLEDGTLEWESTARGFDSWVNEAVFRSDGSIAAVSSDHTLRLFDTDGVLTRTQDLPSLPTAVASIGGMLALHSVNGVVSLWPQGTFAEPSERGRVFELAGGGAAGRLVASLGAGDGLLQVDRVEDDGERTALDVPATEHRARFTVDVSPDGSLVASGGDGQLLVWRVQGDSLSGPTALEVLPGAQITSVSFSPDGSRIAVGDQSSDTVAVVGVSEAPGGAEAGVRLEVQQEVPVTTGGAMAFADDDTLVVHDGTWDLLLWDLAAGSELGRVDMEGQRPVAVERRPGHPGQLAFATESLQVGILDLSDREAPEVIGRSGGLTDAPRGLSFSSDGSQLAIAAVSHVDVREVSDDGEDLETKELRLEGPVRTEITDARFMDGDGRMVASTYSGNLWWWDLDPERAAQTICDEVGAPLTLEDAQALAPSVPDSAQLCSGR